MTYCLGIKVKDGLVGLADTRILTGHEMIKGRKVFTYQEEGSCMFLMTSGLRSLTDKVLTYFQEEVLRDRPPFPRLYLAANALSSQIRRVADEDRKALSESSLEFNIHCLLGGQLSEDETHKLFLIYPQANWVEIEEGTPYQSVGARTYAKALLDRALHFNDTMAYALKIAFLAFNSTRSAAVDVGFPMDIILYKCDSYQIVEHRFEHSDLRETAEWWNDNFRDAVNNLPSSWMNVALEKLNIEKIPDLSKSL